MPCGWSIVRGAAVASAAAALACAVSACGGGGDGVARTGDERAQQARSAALDAGLDDEVADFLALVARGDTATYRVRYPGPTEGTELVVTNRPPDRRVDVLVDGATTEVRLVTDGQAFECTRPEGTGGGDDGAALRCERTDALVDPPGVFRPSALDDLREALADRAEDYTFAVETTPVAGVDARCLVTRLRSGQESAELGESGTICVSAEGALLLVDQGDERLEAIDHSTDVGDDAFVRPDQREPTAAGAPEDERQHTS